MLERRIYGLLTKDTPTENPRRGAPTSTGTIVGAYTYWDDLVLHPRWVPRPAKFAGDWDAMENELRLDSDFRQAVGVREPMDDFAELSVELRRVFSDDAGPLIDDPGRGITYRLALLVPTLNCGVVGAMALGSPDCSIAYLPPFSEEYQVIDGFDELRTAPTLGKFGQLATDYSDALAERWPGKKQCRLTETSNLDRQRAFAGLGFFAEPMLARLRIPEPNRPVPPRRTPRKSPLLRHWNPLASRGRTTPGR